MNNVVLAIGCTTITEVSFTMHVARMDDPTYLVQLPGSRLAGTVLVAVGVGVVDVGAAEVVGVGVVRAIQRICPT